MFKLIYVLEDEVVNALWWMPGCVGCGEGLLWLHHGLFVRCSIQTRMLYPSLDSQLYPPDLNNVARFPSRFLLSEAIWHRLVVSAA